MKIDYERIELLLETLRLMTITAKLFERIDDLPGDTLALPCRLAHRSPLIDMSARQFFEFREPRSGGREIKAEAAPPSRFT